MAQRSHLDELLQVLLSIRSPKLLKHFLTDLLTPQELKEITTRWQIVKNLAQGMPQRKIAKKLHVSISKITRGSREMLDPHGGFQMILKKK